MVAWLRKYRVHLAAGTILLLAFIFYSLNLKNKEHANPFERGVMTLMAPLTGGVSRGNGVLSGIWADYIDLVHVRQENKELRQSVKALNTRLLESQEAVLTNERLKRLLDLKSSLKVQTASASVIGEDASPWFKSIVIDRGQADGLREGMPIIVADGVVGQVVKVAARSSRVLLLTDTASSVAGIVLRSRARGVVKGKGDGRCSLEFAVREDDVQVGDIITTSGIGGLFPKGIPLGEVTMVKKGDYGIFQTIEVRPIVSASKLEEVLVLLTVPS